MPPPKKASEEDAELEAALAEFDAAPETPLDSALAEFDAAPSVPDVTYEPERDRLVRLGREGVAVSVPGRQPIDEPLALAWGVGEGVAPGVAPKVAGYLEALMQGRPGVGVDEGTDRFRTERDVAAELHPGRYIGGQVMGTGLSLAALPLVPGLGSLKGLTAYNAALGAAGAEEGVDPLAAAGTGAATALGLGGLAKGLRAAGAKLAARPATGVRAVSGTRVTRGGSLEPSAEPGAGSLEVTRGSSPIERMTAKLTEEGGTLPTLLGAAAGGYYGSEHENVGTGMGMLLGAAQGQGVSRLAKVVGTVPQALGVAGRTLGAIPWIQPAMQGVREFVSHKVSPEVPGSVDRARVWASDNANRNIGAFAVAAAYKERGPAAGASLHRVLMERDRGYREEYMKSQNED